jgi:Tfp pilus assembly protein PilX
MLTTSTPARSQHGIVLFITLIVLVAMTLAGIALVRSVSTTNLIAGNLAFQQGAVFAADTGIENAVAWLEQNDTGTTLHADNSGTGYLASRQDPVAGQSWDDFWNNQLAASAFPATPVADAAGNSVQYVIQRLCAAAGDPSAVGVNCASPPTSDATAGSSKSAGMKTPSRSSSVYYRITSRVAGPRNTVSYVQAIVSL